MNVLVISGFLGAGKTTFIRTLLQRTGIHAAVLENEYGDTDLDKKALEKESPLQVLEFMEGCVCCTKKDSFVNTILAISAGLDPDWLIVEPSGVGKLSAITENISRVSYDRIRPAGSVLVVAPRSLHAVMADYPDIVQDQIANADRIVLSKCESEDADVIAETVAEIRKYNADAPVLTSHYSLQGDGFWQEMIAGGNAVGGTAQTGSSASGNPEPDDTGEHTLSQVTLHEGAMQSFGELVVFLEDILHGTFGVIVRAKGVLKTGEGFVRFDVADGLYAVIGEADENARTQCVFIGNDIRETKLRERLGVKETLRMKPVRNASKPL